MNFSFGPKVAAGYLPFQIVRRIAQMGGGRQIDFVLELRLVGRMRLLRADGVEITPKGRKAQGLLALLGVAPELRRHRSWLQDKLWSERPPEQGAASLRQELAGIRRALGAWSACLTTDGGWVALDPGRVRVRLDPEPGDWELTGAPPEFVAGLDIADPEFEDWIRDQRAVFADRLEAGGPPPAAPALAVRERPAPIDLEELQPSVAVMPVTLLGDLPEGGLVATGLAIDLIGHLTRFRRLDVIAYASTSALPPRLTARETGAHLGARYVTQGVLWLSRARMRLSFDLIEAASERVLWSRVLDRAFDDLFEVENEMASAVAAGMMVEIDQVERNRARARNPLSLAAYTLCLRGLDDMLSLDPARCQDALGHFSRAVALDDSYARAFSGISRAHGFRWKYRWAEQREAALTEAEAFALRAVDADANDPGASAALGWVALYRRDHDRSLEAYEHAMDLNPSDADVLAEYADALKHSGEPDAAVPLFERAIRLNPYAADHYLKDLVHTHYVREDYEAAIRTVRRMRRKNTILRTLAASQAMLGLDDEARETVRLLREVGHGPMLPAEDWVTMIPDRDASYTARLLEGMKRAGL
jgi:TolB-like protein/DNA-binding SARP family transcriptional activator